MKQSSNIIVFGIIAATVVAFSGCKQKEGSTSGDSKQEPGKAQAGGKLPVFSLAWSEYPSWSVFGVASELGLINGEAGKVGPIEQKWGVDIELKPYSAAMLDELKQRHPVSASCAARRGRAPD